MKRFPLSTAKLIVIPCLLLGVGAVLRAGASDKPWKQPAWKVPPQQYDVIDKLNAPAGTLTIHHMGGKQKVVRDLKVDKFTDIQVADKHVTLADFKPGMRVDYILGGDGTTLSRLIKVEAPAPPPTPVPTATPSFPHPPKAH